MNRLTDYWKTKRFALDQLLAATFPPAQSANKNRVKKWFDRITILPTTATSPEALLIKALNDLDEKRGLAAEMEIGPDGDKKPNPKRRSQRLLRLVQGAIGNDGNSTFFSATIGDIYPGGGLGGPVGDYYKQASDTSEAAANFLSAVKSEREKVPPANDDDEDLGLIVAALQALRAAAPATVNPFVLECIDGLLVSMEGFLAHGGGGDGSGYWPSTIISSSSSSGG